ncbi:MAG TPA: YceI family protein [Candidatus Eisenbacteria bacterium]|nr:YceI family protein [Candidatus Eisenbacteria bacterium]
MRKLISATFLALTLAFASAASAAPATWSIDPSHSQVGFSIRHFFSKVPGTFSKFTGSVVYDPQKPENSSVKADIDPASIDTKNEKRDNHLRSEDFFDVVKFPALTFVSTKVTADGENKLKVDGNLTMHGVTKLVTLEVTFLGAGPSRQGEQRSGFEATTSINRKDFGILWNKTLDQGGTMLGDDVDIKINVEGVIRPDQPAPPAKS